MVLLYQSILDGLLIFYKAFLGGSTRVYANEPKKLKKMLNAIDDKIPGIMSGEVVLPPLKIKIVPERVPVRTPKPNEDQYIER